LGPSVVEVDMFFDVLTARGVPEFADDRISRKIKVKPTVLLTVAAG